jgi:integrator complex subunit 6
MKGINRLDDLMRSIQQDREPDSGKVAHAKLLQRDVYICEWLSPNGSNAKAPTSNRGQDIFPVFVRGACRNSTTDGTDNLLSIGILHVPKEHSTSVSQSQTFDNGRLSTLTLLPPDVHIVLPLLIRAAEIEYKSIRMKDQRLVEANRENRNFLKKSSDGGTVSTLIRKVSDNACSAGRPTIFLDDHWSNEMRAYIYRIPPYYLVPVKRCLRTILPSSVHHLLGTDTVEAITAQCFSKLCHQKIRAGEATARATVDRLHHRCDDVSSFHTSCEDNTALGYGRYDRIRSIGSYLAALREMSPPWKQKLSAAKLQEEKVPSPWGLSLGYIPIRDW